MHLHKGSLAESVSESSFGTNSIQQTTLSLAPWSARPEEVDRQPMPEAADLNRAASLILSAMNVARNTLQDSRHLSSERRSQNERFTWQTRCELRLFADASDADPRVLFTRDIEPRALGFISPERLPLGYGGQIVLPDPAGGADPLRLEITLTRCRVCPGGWFEGALYFHRPQRDLVDAVRAR